MGECFLQQVGHALLLTDIGIMQTPAQQVILQIEALTKQYGGFLALQDVSFGIRRGEKPY